MNQKLLRYCNLVMAGLLGIALLWAGWSWIGMWRTPQGDLTPRSASSRTLAKNPFEQTEEAYQAVEDTLLSLERASPQLSMPDLSKVFTYVGSNVRPDADPDQRSYYVILKGDTEPRALQPDRATYLVYDAEQKLPRYVWSEGGTTTRLWVQVQGRDEELFVTVHLRGLEKEQTRQFSLKEQQRAQGRGESWTLGGFRVDGTLLARQKARWYGTDLFLAEHGGKEYAHLLDRQRIDLFDGEMPYSVWVGPDGCLFWDGRRWREADLAKGDSRDKPLLCVKSLGDKVMSLTLWDIGGSRKATLNLIKSNEVWQPQILAKEFRFVGARTRTQSIMEIRGKRTTLRLYDWLLFVDNEWKRLSSEKEIDDYVERRVVGPLFVFEGIEKVDGVHWLRATLYNGSRTAKEELLLSAQERKRGSEPVRSASQEEVPPMREMPDFEEREVTPGVRGVIPPPQQEAEGTNENRE